jgi:hypothetical protein
MGLAHVLERDIFSSPPYDSSPSPSIFQFCLWIKSSELVFRSFPSANLAKFRKHTFRSSYSRQKKVRKMCCELFNQGQNGNIDWGWRKSHGWVGWGERIFHMVRHHPTIWAVSALPKLPKFPFLISQCLWQLCHTMLLKQPLFSTVYFSSHLTYNLLKLLVSILQSCRKCKIHPGLAIVSEKSN